MRFLTILINVSDIETVVTILMFKTSENQTFETTHGTFVEVISENHLLGIPQGPILGPDPLLFTVLSKVFQNEFVLPIKNCIHAISRYFYFVVS